MQRNQPKALLARRLLRYQIEQKLKEVPASELLELGKRMLGDNHAQVQNFAAFAASLDDNYFDSPPPDGDEDEDETQNWFVNHYYCDECDEEWDDEWYCMCNDRCPNCNAEIEPHASEEVV